MQVESNQHASHQHVLHKHGFLMSHTMVSFTQLYGVRYITRNVRSRKIGGGGAIIHFDYTVPDIRPPKAAHVTVPLV